MKAVCIKQPWASLIAMRAKTIEVRTWRTRYRGDLLVCVSKSPDREGMRRIDLRTLDVPTGVALCVVELVDVRQSRPDDAARAWVQPAMGTFVWELAPTARPVDRFAVTGKLSFFEVDDALIHVRAFTPPDFAPLRALDPAVTVGLFPSTLAMRPKA